MCRNSETTAEARVGARVHHRMPAQVTSLPRFAKRAFLSGGAAMALYAFFEEQLVGGLPRWVVMAVSLLGPLLVALCVPVVLMAADVLKDARRPLPTRLVDWCDGLGRPLCSAVSGGGVSAEPARADAGELRCSNAGCPSCWHTSTVRPVARRDGARELRLVDGAERDRTGGDDADEN